MSVITTNKLKYVYSAGTPYEIEALKDIDLDIYKGDFLGVIGHTGSGKSTLIQHFNGLVKPTSGTIMVNGEDIWKDKSKIRQFRFKVGLVFQYPEYQLFEETVAKDIAFGPKNMGLSEDEINERVIRSISFVGLDKDYLEKSPFELSGGEKRRVAIAGVMAMSPEVLVLDEPTAGLDPMGRIEILNQIKKYHMETGSTVILVSHSMEDIAKIADKVLVMNNGKIVMYDSCDLVFERGRELSEIGLDVPQITKIFMALKEKGVVRDDGVYTVEKAADILAKLLEKRSGLNA